MELRQVPRQWRGLSRLLSQASGDAKRPKPQDRGSAWHEVKLGVKPGISLVKLSTGIGFQRQTWQHVS